MHHISNESTFAIPFFLLSFHSKLFFSRSRCYFILTVVLFLFLYCVHVIITSDFIFIGTLVLDIHCSGICRKIGLNLLFIRIYIFFTVLELKSLYRNRILRFLYLIRVDTFRAPDGKNTSWMKTFQTNFMGFNSNLNLNSITSNQYAYSGDDVMTVCFPFGRRSGVCVPNIFNVDLVLFFFTVMGVPSSIS